MKIKPTLDQIKFGSTHASFCPYALAIVAACPALEGRIAVLTSQTGIGENGDGEYFENPPEMIEWIQEYDEFTHKAVYLSKYIFFPVEAPEVDLPFLDEYCNDLSN